MSRITIAAVTLSIALSGCQCGPTAAGSAVIDAGETQTTLPEKRDGGATVPPNSTVVPWPTTFASEPCPADAFDTSSVADGGLRLGICIVLHTLTADAFLDARPETEPVTVQFLGGGFRSELARVPDAQGVLQVQVMRGYYDILQHQSAGVWPFAKGFVDHGPANMTADAQRNFRLTSHLLRGGARFGALPFTPSTFPQDVWLDGFGSPSWQTSMVTSQGGSYELRMLEGSFGLYLSTPALSLFGTELQKFPLTPGSQLMFDRDQEFDIDLPTSVLEGSITLDGKPIPDGVLGPDFSISYTRPGDGEATVVSRHEGGLAEFTALVPKGMYGTALEFEGAPNRTLPSRISGKGLKQIDLRHDTSFTVDFETRTIEGAVLIDGVPPPPRPNSNFKLYLFGLADATSNGSFLLYEIPRVSSSFNLKAFPGNYLTVLRLDEGLSDALATGYWVVDRYFQLQTNRSLPISIETARFSGRITIDGQVPVPHQAVGTLSFRNRALDGEYSWFMQRFVAGEDGSFVVRVPKGEYEVFFTIDPDTYPTYASGRQLLFSRVPLSSDVSLDVDYQTMEISGPLRVAGQVLADAISGPEVGLRLQRQQDLQNFKWTFQGGQENYVLRVPKGSYALDFVIFENALSGVAWGNAPMGLKLNVAQAGEPFMNFTR